MTFTVHGVDGFLDIVAVLCFLVAAIVFWVAPGHRAGHVLVSAGLFCWVLTTLVK